MKIGDKIWLSAPDGSMVEAQIIRISTSGGGSVVDLFPDKTKAVGIQIKDLRVRKGLVQKQLATKAGVSEATVVGIEKGNRVAHGSTLMAIYNALINLPDKKAKTETSPTTVQRPNPTT